jgi:prepilin-type N-terminal cleavage/methylation domain-containing protein
MNWVVWENLRPNRAGGESPDRGDCHLLPPSNPETRQRLGHPHAFTLIELLVVMAIIAILAGLLLPALSRAKEKAKVAKVHVELYGIGLALQMYADDYEGRMPPVRVNCNSDLSEHWCQLPTELAAEHYLPRSDQGGREANMEDPFDPGHTYKYAAPGPQLLNGDPSGNYALWVPTNFPSLSGSSGKYYTDPKASPVRWILWSLGPKPKSKKSQSTYAPMSSDTWYHRTGDGGVIIRYATRDGIQFKSP